MFLESALRRCSSDALADWQFPVGFDAEGAARRAAAGHLGCAVPMVENDLLRASRVKFDTLCTGADHQYGQPKVISGCAGGSRYGSAGVLGRRALRSSRGAQALVSSSAWRVASQSQVDDKFADNFVPCRRVTSCDSDLDSLHLIAPSVSGSSVSLRSVSRVSLCCGACVGECGARRGVSSEHVGDSVNSEGDLSDHNSWKHGPEASGGTKALNQGSGNMGGRSFVDTAVGGAALAQCLRGVPEGTKVEAWEGRIFTCSRTTTWEVSVAEGCKVTVSAIYLPKKRPGLPAPGPLYRYLFGWSRLLYTPFPGIWIFQGALRSSQVCILFLYVLDFSSCLSGHTTGGWIHTAATNSITLHLALDPEIKPLTFLCFSTFAL